MKTAMIGAVLAAALSGAALVSCGDDDDACTEQDVQICEDDYATCLENLDSTSPDYPEASQACYDALCACLRNGDCESTGFNCVE